MFVDKATVKVQAGDGGDGYVSFRQEKFIDKGGPDGGDGGNGGDVIFFASNNQNTLSSFRYQRELVAESGDAGFSQKKHGKSGKDLIVKVPVGTIVYDDNDLALADLTEDGQQAIIARGGKGGYGNAHFTSSRRQAPRIAEKGEKGDCLDLKLELKVIADVGIVGLPNAGKSTLLASSSNARPEIANYAFTTLIPNLGVVPLDKENNLLIADVPGLIEGASLGKGLGDEFLRHVERTKVLIHLIDAYQEDVVQAYQTIQKELKDYQVDLTSRPQIVVLNKIDGLDEEIIASLQKQLAKVIPKGTQQFAISAVSGQGVKPMFYAVKKIVDKVKAKQDKEDAKISRLPVIGLPTNLVRWKVEKLENHFEVSGTKIEKFARRTDFNNEEGVGRLRDIMKKMGIMNELRKLDAQPGQTIKIRNIGEIEY